MTTQKAAEYDAWSGFMEYVYLDLFAPHKRPTIHFALKDSLYDEPTDFCDRFIVLLRNWDSMGAGSFIPEFLGVDMIRAAAYKRVGLNINLSKKEKLSFLQVSRVNKRRILNEDTVYSAIVQSFTNNVI